MSSFDELNNSHVTTHLVDNAIEVMCDVSSINAVANEQRAFSGEDFTWSSTI